MDFSYTDVQKRLLRQALEISSRFGLDYWHEKYREREFPGEFWAELSSRRFVGMLTTPEYGGLGLGLLDLCIVAEALAKGGAGMGLYPFLSNNIASLVLMNHGTDSAKAILPRMAVGEEMVGLAYTEEESGSDAFSIKTTAARRRGGFVLTGSKMFVNNIDHATYFMVMARTTQESSEKRSKGLTLFLVKSRVEGMSFKPFEKLGLDYLSTGEMLLSDVFVEEEMVVGEVDGGWRALVNALNADRIVYAATAVGIGLLALNIATQYAKERYVFGRPIGMNQAIQFPLTASYAELEAARTHVYRSAWLFDSGKKCDVAACLSKYLATEAAFRAVENAMRTLGGHSYIKSRHVERLLRDVWLMKVGPLTQELALAYVAEKGLGLPRSF